MVEPAYVDASALTASISRDEGADRVDQLFTALPEPLLISGFGWGEFVAAVGRRVRTTAPSEPPATALIEAARGRMTSARSVATTTEDIAVPTDFVAAFSLALKLPDAIHIALARRLGATLVSTDRQQVAAARALAIACTNPLEVTP